MSSIVLNSFMRSSIRFEKMANLEADRLADLNSRGTINAKEAGNIAFNADAEQLSRAASDLEFEISKADKAIGTLSTSLAAIDQMRVLVDRAKILDEAAQVETDSSKIAALNEQANELKRQIANFGETASFRGENLFSGWGQQSVSVGGQTFTLESFDISDITRGFAYRGGNILGIESGDFDTSSYSKLVAAFGPDTINNQYSDFTGNLPAGSMMNGASIAQSGPNGSYSVELAGGTNRTTGAHVVLPDLTIPQEFTIGLWGRYDNSSAVNGRFFDFSNNGNVSDDLTLARVGTGSDVWFWHETSRIQAGTPEIVNGAWQHWMVTVDAVGDAVIYKDGARVADGNLGYLPTEIVRTDNYLGAAWTAAGATMAGGVADFVVFDGVMDDDAVSGWYNSVGLTGLENSFYTMSADKIETALDRIEAQMSTTEAAIKSTRDQLVFKKELHSDAITNLLSIDTEEVAVQSNLAQMRQTLAMTSLSIASSSQANILSLFG